jgi:hypothetical protein
VAVEDPLSGLSAWAFVDAEVVVPAAPGGCGVEPGGRDGVAHQVVVVDPARFAGAGVGDLQAVSLGLLRLAVPDPVVLNGGAVGGGGQRDAGFTIDESQRLKAGTVERVAATKPR